jgi:hypothetical protein
MTREVPSLHHFNQQFAEGRAIDHEDQLPDTALYYHLFDPSPRSLARTTDRRIRLPSPSDSRPVR